LAIKSTVGLMEQPVFQVLLRSEFVGTGSNLIQRLPKMYICRA
jgi:hypothetical protein